MLQLLDLFYPGQRIAVAVSGGADSVALLRTLVAQRDRLGLVLSVAHVHHGIRGDEADADAAFVEALAHQYSLPFHLERVDVPTAAASNDETLEEAARNLRYAYFRCLVSEGRADAVATAHTLDDQAETVLHRLIRGAWTEGLGGIRPIVNASQASSNLHAPAKPTPAPPWKKNSTTGTILRPFLSIHRADIEAWLLAIGQPWREDSTNRDQAHTRNRIRQTLMPELAKFNPRIASQLAHVAALARDEEDYWQRELAQILPSLVLPGKPTRGGGRSNSPGESAVAIEMDRLFALHPALRRRALRAAAAQLGVGLDFHQTGQLMTICEIAPPIHAGKRTLIGPQLCVHRSIREIRLSRNEPTASAPPPQPHLYQLPVPGEVAAPAFSIHVRIDHGAIDLYGPTSPAEAPAAPAAVPAATVRAARDGDRVRLRHSARPHKLKGIFDRLHVPVAARPHWPLVEWSGEIIWMQGVDVESAAAITAGLRVTTIPLHRPSSDGPAG